MRAKIPTVAALMAFRAAARHLSITRAASELALTESAISRQIALLESQLGVKLFHRIKKRIVLTRVGAAYNPRVAQALDRLERDALEVRDYEADGTVLEIATLPTVGAQWLIPLLPDFYASNPAATVNISARNARFFFTESALDGALYFGEPDWPGAHADYLFDEALYPVGSSTLLENRAGMSLDEIARLPLLHLVTRSDAWLRWSELSGIGGMNVIRGHRFDTQSALISAAAAGLGVALLPYFLIEKHVRSGDLQILSRLPLKSAGSYYFAFPIEKTEDKLLSSFRHWLQGQARRLTSSATEPAQ